MADKQIVDIQAEVELIVQQPVKHTCTDAVSGTHQIDALILTGRIGTGQRGQKSLLFIEEESVAQTGVISPSFLLGRGGGSAGGSPAIAHSMLGVSLQPFGTESVRIVKPESMRLHEILPKERSHIRFGIQVHNLEEYIVRIRIISGNIEVVLQRISQFCIVSVAGFQVLTSAGIRIFVLIERKRIDHILRRTGDAVGETEVQRMPVCRRIKQIDSREQARIVVLVLRILRFGNTGSAGVLHTQAQLHGKTFGKFTAIISI